MNNLYQRQQEPELIKLLAAQKQLYTEGKRTNSFILIVSFILPVVAPMLNKPFPDLGIPLGFLGGLLSILIISLFNNRPNIKRELGAKVQEQFDIELYGLEWNEELCKHQVADHEITRASLKLKDRSNIDGSPWYEDYSNLEQSRAILMYQQDNLFWDGKLRKKYSLFLKIAAIFLYLACYGIGFFLLELSPQDWLLQVFFPLLVFLFYINDTITKNTQTSIKQAKKVAEATMLLKSHKEKKDSIPIEVLREIQDEIYTFRNDSAMIPDWFYKLDKKGRDNIFKSRAKDKNK